MEPSSEPRRHAQSPMSLRLFYYTAPWLDKSCLGAASARERRRLDHQGPRSTSHSSGAALGHPERPPGASQGPAGPHEGCVRGTACVVSRVNNGNFGQTPPRVSENFAFGGAKKSKSLKNRALRAPWNPFQPTKNWISETGPQKLKTPPK